LNHFSAPHCRGLRLFITQLSEQRDVPIIASAPQLQTGEAFRSGFGRVGVFVGLPLLKLPVGLG